MPKIETCQFVNASDVIPSDVMDAISESGNLTWGDMNRSLVAVARVMVEIENCIFNNELTALQAILTLKALPKGVYIDMEN